MESDEPQEQQQQQQEQQEQHLVLVGGGHAHVQVIKALNSRTRPAHLKVTLIDHKNRLHIRVWFQVLCQTCIHQKKH